MSHNIKLNFKCQNLPPLCCTGSVETVASSILLANTSTLLIFFFSFCLGGVCLVFFFSFCFLLVCCFCDCVGFWFFTVSFFCVSLFSFLLDSSLEPAAEGAVPVSAPLSALCSSSDSDWLSFFSSLPSDSSSSESVRSYNFNQINWY